MPLQCTVKSWLQIINVTLVVVKVRRGGALEGVSDGVSVDLVHIVHTV